MTLRGFNNQLFSKRMEDLGFKDTDIAEKLGVSRGAVNHWRSGVRTPHISKIREMSTILRIGVTALYRI